jgi:signal transduction histidine kinase
MSIRLRLTLYWAAVFAAMLLIAGIAVLLLFQRQQWGELDGALMEEAETAGDAIVHSRQGAAAQIVRRLSEERDLGPSRRVRLTRGGSVIADWGDHSADLPVLPNDGSVRGMFEGDRNVFRYAIVRFTLARESAYLADGVDATPVRRSIARLRASLTLILPLLLGISALGGYWLAGRALVPINSLAAGLAEISPRDLSRRLVLGDANDEVARLTRAINALLDRVERASIAERRFAVDAAHELRTPLTVLRTGLEVALGRDRGAREYADALGAALHEAVALCRMADELLTLSRLDEEASFERELLSLRDLMAEVGEAVEPLVQTKHLALQANLNTDVFVDGNRNYLRRLLINLLDNALKFTPSQGRIAMTIESFDGHATLRIADNGPGIPSADLPFIFDRFFRGRTRNEPGSGLGLSLCREIARLHGGDISAHNLDCGGIEFIVTLPASTPRSIALASGESATRTKA